MWLYGRNWTRRELEERVGRIEQMAGVRRVRATEGLEQDLEIAQVRTGAGLQYDVNLSRGMDVSLCQLGGSPLSWQAPQGDVGPAYYDANGIEWLRTACGGLLMTCGLRQVGSPCTDAGESLGLHGRIHHLPGRQIRTDGIWDGDDYVISVSGLLEEARIFGENLALRRIYSSRLGVNEIVIRDEVENRGFSSTPLMLLYHFNFGFPLLTSETVLEITSGRVSSRDKNTVMEGICKWENPASDFAERVYYHSELKRDNSGFTTARLLNPRFPVAGCTGPIEVELSWRPEQLPYMVQWKMCGRSTHVMGLEPANCLVGGRSSERIAGRLSYIEPGEKRVFELRLTVKSSF
ncbi:MAG TPA: aldose 1-epimerase family protein [Victivallales bacterium]|nr:aldose 1-epimerase family protein [Victivallales bacterium]